MGAMGSDSKPVAAGGVKLSQKVVDALRALGDKCNVRAAADKYQLHPRTIRRVLKYQTWVAPITRRLPDTEHKQCTWCGVLFGRRYKNGRHLSQKQWIQKKTCSPSCNMYSQWANGVYDDRL
jgi:hypothetical protein